MNHGFTPAAACAVVLASSLACGSGPRAELDTLQAVQKYCTASWRQARIPPQDWEDCTQQVFVALLDRVSRDRLTEALGGGASPERRELSRAIWSTEQRWRRARKHHCLGQRDMPDTRQSCADAVNEARQTIAEASQGLTERQRRIIAETLDGATVAEISAALDIPAARVSDDKYKAIQRIRSRCG